MDGIQLRRIFTLSILSNSLSGNLCVSLKVIYNYKKHLNTLTSLIKLFIYTSPPLKIIIMLYQFVTDFKKSKNSFNFKYFITFIDIT